MTHEQLACVGYEANRAYAASIGEQNPPWDEAVADDRQLWILAAQYCTETPGFSDADLHQLWCGAEQAIGWSYGPVLDNDRKRHPHLVPWDVLPEPQRRKVTMFRLIVQALIF